VERGQIPYPGGRARMREDQASVSVKSATALTRPSILKSAAVIWPDGE